MYIIAEHSEANNRDWVSESLSFNLSNMLSPGVVGKPHAQNGVPVVTWKPYSSSWHRECARLGKVYNIALSNKANYSFQGSRHSVSRHMRVETDDKISEQ